MIDLTESVLQFTADYLEIDQEALSLDTCLSHDLRIAGDDGYEFMVAFAEKFKVDLTGFDFVRYFGPESSGLVLFLPLVYLYWWLFRRDKLQSQHITIGDLVKIAGANKWLE